MAYIIIALTIHELGHLIAIIMLNIKFQKIKITLFGFNLNIDVENISLIKKIILFFSGPFLNIIMFIVMKRTEYIEFAQINLFLACINLIPIIPLDGGNICKSILDSLIDKNSVHQYMIMTNIFFALLFLVSIYLYGNLIFLLLIIMSIKGIEDERRYMFERSVKYNYYNRIKRKHY